MKTILSISFLLLLVSELFGQANLGQWTNYQSFTDAKKVAVAGQMVYCATSGGLFSYNKDDNSIQKLTSVNGLSDVGIQTIAFGEESGTLLVAYENSNIDLINGQDIFNLSDIKRKQILGDKHIYNILFVGQTAYLSTGFGVVAINMEKKEVKDTYYIGNEGSAIVVYDLTFDGQYLYAATEKGIYQADINAPNLQDYKHWLHLDNVPHANEAFSLIDFFNGSIIAAYSGADFNTDELYRMSGSSWDRYLPEITYVDDLRSRGDLHVLARTGQVDVYDQNRNRVTKISSYLLNETEIPIIHARSATIDNDKNIWIADSEEGMVKAKDDSYECIVPSGPTDNNVFSTYTFENDLWISSGGYNGTWDNRWNAPQIQRFRDDKWTAFTREKYEELIGIPDLVSVIADPADPDHIYVGSWGGGIIEFRGEEFIERYSTHNSSLQNALSEEENPENTFVRIGGMAFDSKGNLWATNAFVGEPLSVFKTDGSWESFELDGVTNSYIVGKIVITENDDQWIVLPKGNDLFVRKGDGSDERKYPLIAYFTNGTDESYPHLNDIFSMEIDNEGAIWFGTSKGVAVIYNPEDIWEHQNFYASQPGLDLNDGIYHPLLETETVTAIAVDGGNRKWFGTKNSGVYLISEDGEHELKHFTESNSPLLSNEITSISIAQKTGEVFLGTTKGLISYMGEATRGSDEYADVYAYPNPVREDYYGDIVITGLIENTDVKITDISGNLVYETTSIGGQAIWNGKNSLGHRVSTGVYMVFGNDRMGEKTFVTKILFIH